MKLTKKYRYRLFEEFEGEIVGTDRYFICDKNEKGKLIMGIEEKEEKEHFDHMYTNIYQWYEGNKCQIMKVFVLHQPLMKDKDYIETEGVEFEMFLWKLDDKNVDENTLRIELVGDFGMIENKKYLFFDSIFESKCEKEFVR